MFLCKREIDWNTKQKLVRSKRERLIFEKNKTCGINRCIQLNLLSNITKLQLITNAMLWKRSIKDTLDVGCLNYMLNHQGNCCKAVD